MIDDREGFASDDQVPGHIVAVAGGARRVAQLGAEAAHQSAESLLLLTVREEFGW